MSQKTLQHGQIVGLRCPHCPLVAQRVAAGGWGDGTKVDATAGGSALVGLEAHVRVVHSEHYEAWVATFRGPAADELDRGE